MRWREIAMAGLGLVLALVVTFCVLRSADLSLRAQRIYASSGEQGSSQQQQDRALVLQQQSSGLQQLIMPLSTGSLACGLGVLLVLGRRWQLRDGDRRLAP